MAIIRHILSILLLPVVVTVVVPYFIVSSRFRQPGTWSAASLPGTVAAIAGGGLMACGLMLVCRTIWQFATIGRGTLAPWDPPRHLVVAGIYRRVRNPMISGVLLILLGEALACRSAGLLVWAVTAFTVNAIYIPLVEERGLERRFGDEYREYKRHVPRWVPRAKPWEPPWTQDEARSG
jgi:protein-S-isoprenylcysteine O-methyltransferase Ste14